MDSFIVSARKYRPATFASVIGQLHITSTLKNAINRNQLAHAYLFCGPRGVGKTTCARIFAKAINCLNPSDGEACNTCESCSSFNEGRSFNIHELDAASNNSVDDIRSLTDQVRIPPQIGRYSVYIIDEVHMLSLQAFNAFLKTLEEPPAHAVFILATTEKHKIIPTILSRCQTYDFNRIRVEDSVQYLKYIASQEGVTYDEESLHIIAQKADGGMRDALSMFDKVVSFCGSALSGVTVAQTLNVLDYETYFTTTKYILNGDYTEALLLFDQVLSKGFSGQTFIGGLNNHFRDILMCKNPQTIPLLEVTGGVAERYKRQAEECSISLLFEGINLLTAIDSSFRTTTNQRLHVELGLMKLCGLGQKKNQDTLTDGDSSPIDGDELFVVGNVVLPPLIVRRPQVEVVAAVAAQSSMAPVIQAASAQAVEKTSAPVPNASGQAVGNEITVPSHSVTSALEDRVIPEDRTVSVDQRITLDGRIASDELASATVDLTTATVTPPTTSASISFSGRSISSILNTQVVDDESSDVIEVDESEQQIDPQVEEKLERGCELFAKELKVTRPRMAIAFEDISVSGNHVLMRVPNESLHDEILRNIPQMQQHLSELSGVRGMIYFDITIKEPTASLKPIKVDDRVRFLTEKNPLINDLRKELELDVE